MDNFSTENNILRSILEKKKLFFDEMESIEKEDLSRFSKEELLSFKNSFYNIGSSDLISKVDQTIKEKTEQRYPELLDAHYYPEIKELTFLNQKERLELDKVIALSRKSNAFFKIPTSLAYEHQSDIYKFLLEKEILTQEIQVLCTCDYQYPLTERFDAKLKEQWLEDLKHFKNTKNEIGLLEKYPLAEYCDECGNDYISNLSINDLEELNIRKTYRKIKGYDPKWDDISLNKI